MTEPTSQPVTEPAITPASDANDGHPRSATISFGSVAFDCVDPYAEATFYSRLLGGRVDGAPGEEWVSVIWNGPEISFQLAPNHEDPRWPDGQQQAHIDFTVEDIVRAHALVLELGGTALDPVQAPEPAPERGWRVYADPAGHTFCLCRPRPDAWN